MESSLDQCIVIIGGGVGGCSTALELADAGYDIKLIEKEQELMRCSSDATPGRMGLGFHYADLKTACYALHATVRFTKEFGRFREAVDKPLQHPLRRGRYFILKTSQVDPQQILRTYEGIKHEYANMVAMDPSNEVFGPPDDLYRILDEKEYADDVAPGIVEYGIETAEELLDWKQFREYLLQEIKKRERMDKIKVYLSTGVDEIQKMDEKTYCISCSTQDESLNQGAGFKLCTTRLVNATWYNIGQLNKSCGLTARPRLNRVKAIVTIRLSPGMENLHSMFFCAGPFCVFSNKGNGVGMITFAPVTNITMCTSDELQPEMGKNLHELTSQEKHALGKRILQGAVRYIPKIATVSILKVNIGVVQTYLDDDHFVHASKNGKNGNLDFIHDPVHGSGIDKRDYSGVEVIAPGFVVNACMKLLYCMDNARAVRKIFDALDCCY